MKRSASKRIRILIADDHAVVRDGLSFYFGGVPDFEIVGDARDGRQAVDRVQELRPDVVVMDVAMPHLNGADATRIIKNRWPETEIIGLSADSADAIGRAMFAAGASAYFRKDEPLDGLVASVRALGKKIL